MSKVKVVEEENVKPFGQEETQTTQVSEEQEPPMAIPDQAPEAQGKSQTRVRREDGKIERKRRALSLGISELLLPPYTRRGIATYRLRPTYEKDPATGEVPVPTNDEFEGSYSFFDKFEKDPIRKMKTMYNYGKRKPIHDDKTGETTLKYEIEPILFQRGLHVVNIMQNYRRYVFMELHPSNGTNKNRPMQAPILFERIDIQTHKSSSFRAAEADLAIEAELYVKKLTREQLIGYAVNAGLPVTGQQPSDISVALRMYARDNPKQFFSFIPNSVHAIKMDILDANDLGMIEFMEDMKSWIECESGEKLFTVAVGEDPVAALAEKTAKDAGLYDQIKSLVDYWDRTPI